MRPVEQAAAMYSREPDASEGRSFREDLEAYLLDGIVHSDSACFIMARYIARPGPDDLTCAPADCLHIYLAAGDISGFFTIPHRPARWVSFARKGVMRVYPYEQIRQRCTRNQHPISAPI